ncbi:MAG: endolytic transglycosylase MltG [Candidatus Paceibacterota bacterium]|jgi:UPF0755 protein
MNFRIRLAFYIKETSAFLTFYKREIFRGVSIIVSILVILFFFAWNTPSQFKKDTIFSVPTGSGLTEIANNLKEDHVIRSAFWYKVFSVIYGNNLIAGDYLLDSYQTVFGIVGRLNRGEYRLKPIKVTIPEGLTIREISLLLQKQLHRFDARHFIELTKDKEGYLFPDTYFFLPNQNPEIVMKMMTDTFNKKLTPIAEDISKFKKSLNDVITMASILEEEGKSTRDRQIIAGILWKRIAKGMPLQVDAPFRYSIGKDSYTLTKDDLRIDNPYNTYTRKGLPPTPITNPGLDSILAAVHPITTSYYFFLSERDGTTHYATTYNEHLENKVMYLR